MLDPRHEDFFQRMPPEFLRVDQANLQYAQVLSIATPLGLTRLAGGAGALDSHMSYLNPLPADGKAAARATMFYNPRHWETSLAERGVIEESFAQVRETILPHAIPLRVLIGERGADAWQPAGTILSQSARDQWMALQQEHAVLSSEGEWVIIEDSGHYIHLDRPDAVIEAILALLPSS
jgi:pimeloyl-ACP methyl ester carboxylesterase